MKHSQLSVLSKRQPTSYARPSVLILLLIMASSQITGCLIAVPFISAFKQSGFTEDDRRALLPKEIQKFQDALYWDDRTKIMSMVLEQSRDSVAKTLTKAASPAKTGTKIVESRIDNLEFQEDATKASVTVSVKFFQAPFYVVQIREEQQRWHWGGVGSGKWLLAERTLGEARVDS